MSDLSVEARMDQMEERLYRIARRGPSDVKGLAWATLRDLAALRGDWVIALAGAVLAGIEVDEESPAEEDQIDDPLPEATCARQGCQETFDRSTTYEGTVQQRGRPRRYCSLTCQTQAKIPKAGPEENRRRRRQPDDGKLTCTHCGFQKPEEEFQLRADTGFQTRRGECDACREEYRTQRYLSVAKGRALNQAGLTFVVGEADEVADLVCAGCGAGFEVGQEVHGSSTLRHTGCPESSQNLVSSRQRAVRPGARGRQDPSALKRSYDRKVSPRGIWQESRRRWVPTVGNSFGLPAGVSCPGKTRFCGSCYASIAEQGSGVSELVAHNLRLLLEAATTEAMAELLDDMLVRYEMEADRAGIEPADRAFRIHWDGDFFSLDYADAWALAMPRHPDVRFWAYTRSFVEPVNVVPALAGIPNLVLYLSVDRWNVEEGLKVSKKYPVHTAQCAMGGAAAKSLVPGKPGAVLCPENAGRMALMSDGRGACLDCRICVDGRRDVIFTVSGSAAPAQPPSHLPEVIVGAPCANPACTQRVMRRRGPGRPPLYCSAECSRETQRSEADRVDGTGPAPVPTTITDVMRRAEPALQEEHAGV